MEQNSSTFKNDDNLKPLVVIFFRRLTVEMLPDGSTETVHPLLNMFFSDVQKRSA